MAVDARVERGDDGLSLPQMSLWQFLRAMQRRSLGADISVLAPEEEVFLPQWNDS